MPEVIDLSAHRPHEVGPVVCLRCSHNWVAVRPAGTSFLECPRCRASRGASLATMLSKAAEILGEECCGQTDCDGTCAAPACLRGEALKLVESIEAAVQLEFGGRDAR